MKNCFIPTQNSWSTCKKASIGRYFITGLLFTILMLSDLTSRAQSQENEPIRKYSTKASVRALGQPSFSVATENTAANVRAAFEPVCGIIDPGWLFGSSSNGFTLICTDNFKIGAIKSRRPATALNPNQKVSYVWGVFFIDVDLNKEFYASVRAVFPSLNSSGESLDLNGFTYADLLKKGKEYFEKKGVFKPNYRLADVGFYRTAYVSEVCSSTQELYATGDVYFAYRPTGNTSGAPNGGIVTLDKTITPCAPISGLIRNDFMPQYNDAQISWQKTSYPYSFPTQWAAVTNATQENLDFSGLESSTIFRRVVTSKLSGCSFSTFPSNVVEIIVPNEKPVISTSTSTINFNETKTLVAKPTGGTFRVVSGGGTITNNVYKPAIVTKDTKVTITYTGPTKDNCPAKSADVTFTVRPIISPQPDNGSISSTGGIVIKDVRANDKLSGVAATAANSTIVPVAGAPLGGVRLNTQTGEVSVNQGTTPGKYELLYQLCDLSSPANCRAAIATIEITSVLSVKADEGTVSSMGGIAVQNVRANDQVNGVAATVTNSLVRQKESWPTGITLNANTGAVSVAAGVAPKTYPLSYELCALGTCTTGLITVKVTGVVSPVADAGTSPSTGDIVRNGGVVVYLEANDKINGVQATPANSKIEQSGTWPKGILLQVNIATNQYAVKVENGTAPGIYPLKYKLCDKLSPVTCAEGTITVTVTPLISAVADNSNTVVATGGVAVQNVRANDKVNGIQATKDNSVIEQVTTLPTTIKLDPITGTIQVGNGTAPGKYEFTYRLCDLSKPTRNCTQIQNTINVIGVISPMADEGKVTTAGGRALENVRNNDMVNGLRATNLNSTISKVGIWPTNINLDLNTGEIKVISGLAPGEYKVAYRLCDLSKPANCNDMTVKVTVVVPEISIVSKSGSVSSVTGGVAIANIREVNKVNGEPATEANSIVYQSGTWPSNFSLDAKGVLRVLAGTPTGLYSLMYALSDINKTKSATARIDLQVVEIKPNNDDGGAVASTGGVAVVNVRTNDKVNGVAATAVNSTIVTVGSWPTGITLNANTGSVTVDKGTALRNPYFLKYKLCDKLNNCAEASVTLKVSSSIVLSNDQITVALNNRSFESVLTNDLINGVKPTSENSSVQTAVSAWPSGITLDNTGIIRVSGTVLPRVYTLSYLVSDKITTSSTAQITLNVVKSDLQAFVDEGIIPLGGGKVIEDVRTNDFLDFGAKTKATRENTIVQQYNAGTPWPSGITLDPKTGTVNVAKDVTGLHLLGYKLCELNGWCVLGYVKLRPQSNSTTSTAIPSVEAFTASDKSARSANEAFGSEIDASQTTPSAYPNPVTDEVTLRYFSKEEGGTLDVDLTDLQGMSQLRHRATTNLGLNLIKLNLRHLPSGSYVVRLVEGNKVSHTKIMKIQ